MKADPSAMNPLHDSAACIQHETVKRERNILHFDQAKTAITRVPAAISTRPAAAFLLSFS